MDVPEPRYAKTVDGVSIAYQVVGEGDLDFVFVNSPYLSDIELGLGMAVPLLPPSGPRLPRATDLVRSTGNRTLRCRERRAPPDDRGEDRRPPRGDGRRRVRATDPDRDGGRGGAVLPVRRDLPRAHESPRHVQRHRQGALGSRRPVGVDRGAVDGRRSKGSSAGGARRSTSRASSRGSCPRVRTTPSSCACMDGSSGTPWGRPMPSRPIACGGTPTCATSCR